MISDIFFSVTRSTITYVAPNDQDQSLIFKIFFHIKPVAGVARKQRNQVNLRIIPT